MTLTPLLEMPWSIQLHTGLAVVAVVLGPVVILRRRRDRLHKALGYTWVSAMLGVAVSAFAIPSTLFPILGSLGPIHLLAMLVLLTLARGMRAIYRGHIPAHEAALKGLYWQGLVIAGLLTLLPGRVLNDVLFPAYPLADVAAVLLCGAVLLGVRLKLQKRRKQGAVQSRAARGDFA